MRFETIAKKPSPFERREINKKKKRAHFIEMKHRWTHTLFKRAEKGTGTDCASDRNHSNILHTFPSNILYASVIITIDICFIIFVLNGKCNWQNMIHIFV